MRSDIREKDENNARRTSVACLAARIALSRIAAAALKSLLTVSMIEASWYLEQIPYGADVSRRLQLCADPGTSMRAVRRQYILG